MWVPGTDLQSANRDSKNFWAVLYFFLRALNEYLTNFNPNLRKCIYFSDGAPQQFKNVKHFANICYHEQDFGWSAEWHFHESAHGKGPCDGAGGRWKDWHGKLVYKWLTKFHHRNNFLSGQTKNLICPILRLCIEILKITKQLRNFWNLDSQIVNPYSSFEETDSVCFSKEKSRKKSKLM